ncbi:amino acid adenylation domain-containing protein [Pseudomonas sp. BP8]|uniref:amino acid adenylation domain-containing protein n=1 Tax=Pseudomonas sp. BP8 TaxID=2817864 RepID=UPI001AE4FA07|nr:amino acid adenylation domain-containing protein [Pseudomonas sp. BP8]MBP2261846.1 amino acid adenylation domain-containing protein [Pseudomonas sp. BP8]HDS1737111.1 amino acid adenylation domain-containing protein [Pseudomonas putida]
MPDLRPDPTLVLEYRAPAPIFEGFLQQALRSPDATAIITERATCSYRQLAQISQGIAAYLLEHGVDASDRVVIVASRCASLVYAMLGALRAGKTFTIADVAYPTARVQQIVRTLEPAFVLLCGDANLEFDAADHHRVPRVVRVAEAPAGALQQFFARDQAMALPVIHPDHPAYITFTSGSSGEPKGVVTHHAPLVHFIEWHVRRHGFTAADCFSLLSGLGHDPVYRDVFTPLSIGAKIICPTQSTLIDPTALAAWIHRHEVSVIHLTPALGRLIETGARLKSLRLECLRYLFWGGDALSPALFEQMRAIAPGAVSVNFYGTTETPQAMAFHPLDAHADNTRIPLGKGIDGAQLLVVNDANQQTGEGEVGEILIRSPYLSLGYWRDTALTGEKFVVNPFTGTPGDLCYRTGDLGSYLADGSVSFLGRADSQVKIRGHRIELAEIESAIVRHPRVKQCVVVANHDSSMPRLVAYCVAEQSVSAAELREALAGQLPDYMLPASFVFIDAIPLTPNGKIDTRALPAVANTVIGHQPLSAQAQELSAAWARILQVPEIDANLTFVELGGDSLSFVQASMVLDQLLGHLPDRWEVTPVRELARLANTQKAPSPALRAMELPVLMRMIAIILIVVGHLHMFSTWTISGETTVLFLISGISLARFQFRAIEERGDARLLAVSVASIAVPTILYTVLTQLVFDKVHWQSLLMISNWFTPQTVGHFHYWYIEVLVQMIVIIGLALSFKRVRSTIKVNPFRRLLAASCALLAADIILNLFVFDASPLYYRVPQHYLAIMVLGMAVHFADSTRQKWGASAVALLLIVELDLVALASMGWPELGEIGHIDIALPAVLALIWLKSVAVPGAVARAGAVIASSTLFIYLTHFQFQSIAKRIIDEPLFGLLLAIVGGIAVGYCWNTLARTVALGWKRARNKRQEKRAERVA